MVFPTLHNPYMQGGAWHKSVSSFGSSKTEFLGDFTHWVVNMIYLFLYITAGFFLFTYFVQQLYTLYYDTLQISYPGRYLIRISLNHDSSWGQAVTPTLAAPLQCHTHSWCSWPVVQHRGIKSLSETGRDTSTPGGTTAAKKPPFQKTWNYSVLIFYFLTEVTVIF